jgi:hypothetical protein
VGVGVGVAVMEEEEEASMDLVENGVLREGAGLIDCQR